MKQSKITLLISLGAGLEYYDFIIYSLLTEFISKQFFPSQNPTASLFATFGVFALGYLVRPFGGFIFGLLGDRFGRKNIFTNILLAMAFTTFLMGLVPSFATWGLVATTLFVICRILQGLTFCADFPGALILLSEHINQKQQGLHFGFMVAATSIGVTFGSFITWLLTKTLTDTQMLTWGFRIPFLIGGSLALVGYYIRKHLPETPAFLAMQKAKVKLTVTVIKYHLWQVLNVIGVVIFPASFILFFLALPVYLHNVYHFSFPDIYLVLIFGTIWSAILLPILGWISDYIGRKTMFVISALLLTVFGFPAFSILRLETYAALFTFIMFGQTIIATMAASYFALIPRAFKTSIRYTGTAFSYNITFTIASVVPLIINYIYGVLKQPNYIVWMFIFLAAVAVISVLNLKVSYDDFAELSEFKKSD